MRCWPLLLTICLLAASQATAEIYRWVDENGVVHFSDRPGVEGAERVTGPRPVAPPGQAPAPAGIEAAAQAPEGSGDPAAEAGAEEEAAEATAPQPVGREANCRASQERLERLERAPRLFQLGADGQRQYLDDDQVGEALALARAQMAHWCE